MLCTPKQFLLIGSILSAFVVNDFVTGDDGVLDDDVNNVLKMLMSTEPLPDPMVEFEPDEFLHDSNQLINEMIDFRSEVMSRTGELNDKFDELEKLLRNHPACQADSRQTGPV